MSRQEDDPQVVDAPEPSAAPAGSSRRRSAVGIALVSIGLLVAAAAVWTTVRDDGSGERKVGRLTASHLGADATTTVPKGGSKGSGKGTGTTAATAPPTTGDAGGTATTTPATPPAGTKPAWPAAVSGRPPALGKQGEPPPTSVSGIEDGYYLWQDFYGWHLWLVGDSNATATVTVDADVAKAEAVGGTDVQKEANLFTVSRGSADGEVVGVDFNPGYYAKTMVVGVDGDVKLHVGARRYRVGDYYGLAYSKANA